MFRYGGLVVAHGGLQERAELFRKLIELLDSRPDEVEKPVIPVAAIPSELRRPQARLTKDRFEPHPQVGDRQAEDVLLVEPVELFWIEHRVAAADPLEREGLNQLV